MNRCLPIDLMKLPTRGEIAVSINFGQVCRDCQLVNSATSNYKNLQKNQVEEKCIAVHTNNRIDSAINCTLVNRNQLRKKKQTTTVITAVSSFISTVKGHVMINVVEHGQEVDQLVKLLDNIIVNLKK